MTKVNPSVSIIAPTRNRQASLQRLCDSINEQVGVSVEAIFVDDASDPLIETPASQVPVVLERAEQSVGACRARNIGAQYANGDWLVFVDDDVTFDTPDTLARLISFLDGLKDVGVVALAELNPDGGWGFNLGPDAETLEVARFFGCGVAIRRKCFDEVGGFFEPLGYYYEEFEMSMRVVDAGWRLVFNPQLRIIHYRDPSGRDQRRIRRLISRNALITIAMRFPLWLMPVAALAQSARFTHKCWFSPSLDFYAPFAVFVSALKISLINIRSRRPLSWASLRKYKQLAYCPIVLSSRDEAVGVARGH